MESKTPDSGDVMNTRLRAPVAEGDIAELVKHFTGWAKTRRESGFFESAALDEKAADLLTSLAAENRRILEASDEAHYAAKAWRDHATTAERERDAARAALIKHAIIEEFDYPGDAPVSCGFHCLTCGALHGETKETVQHEPGCALAASVSEPQVGS